MNDDCFRLPIEQIPGDGIGLSSEQNVFTTPEPEGQLSVDVVHTADELIVAATMAGTPPNKIQLHIHNDVLTIRGERPSPVPVGSEYFYEECYWGKFSRTIVLPVDVRPEMARAEYRYGVLTVRLPKVQLDNSIPIYVVEE